MSWTDSPWGVCCADACSCQTDPSRTCQPLNTSSPALNVASCITTGTRCNIDALVSTAAGTITAVLGQKQRTQANAVKAQVQMAQSQYNAYMWVAIAVVAIVGFIAFAKVKVAK